MKQAHPLDKSIGESFPEFRTNADLRNFEAEMPYEQRVNAGSTYEALCNAAALDPDKAAIHFLPTGEMEEDPVTISFRQLLGRIHQTANLFHDLGVGPGDVVSFLLPLLPQAHFVLWGGEAAGIANPVNPLLEPGQLAGIFRAAGTKVLVTLGPQAEPGIWEKVQAFRADVPSLKTIVQVLGAGDEKDGVLSYDALVDTYRADRLDSGREIAADETAAYFHTGGTTGLPKLVPHTHGNQVYQAWGAGVVLQTGPETAVIAGLPLFHVGGALTLGLSYLAGGATIILPTPAGFRSPAVIRNYWRLVERYRCTCVSGVPTVFSGMLQAPSDGVDLSSLQFVGGGGSAIPVEIGHAMAEKSGAPVIEVYGMTETASILTTTLPKDTPRIGSAGLALPYCGARTAILDGDGKLVRECETEEIGVVLMRGPGVFSGYVEERHNQGAFVEGEWVNSGDLGRMDSEGYLWITGRAKDTIIRSGHNIDPIVIEDVLYQHPAVALAAAVGQPDGYAGELPVVYVQRNPDVEADEAEILAFARERIPERAANPVQLYFIDPMPLTLVGKVFKPALRLDAATRCLNEQLPTALSDQGEAGTKARVEVTADERLGTLATVILRDDNGLDSTARDGVAAKVDEFFAPFALHHEIRWE